MGNLQSSNSLPVKQETEDSNESSSLIARESDASDEELERGQHAEMQPKKRQRKMDEQSLVIYGQEQGSSSNSQLTCSLDWLSNNSAVYPRLVTLKEKLLRLFARQRDVLTELEHAENQPGQKPREEVRYWLSEVQRKKDKIQSMIKDGQGTSSNSNLFVSIENFIKEVDELNQRSNFPNGLVLLDQEATRLPLLLDKKPVGKSFQENTEIILGWLQNPKHCIIGIHGMGGVGKTTLLTCIHDRLLRDSNISGHVYWVTVSQNFSAYKLQKDIAKALGLKKFEEDDERKRAAILHKTITAKARIVLILDDMWEQVSGNEVGIPLENSNCKIILSTRSYEVCRKMGCKDFVIKAETLNKGEAWDLFVKKLGHYDKLEEEAKEIAWEIAEECGGLPLAIATMARSLTDVADINEWKDALNELKSSRCQPDMEKNVFRILRYSYDHLSDKRLQECFLSCILYAEDVEISRTELIDLWIDEGQLDDIKSRDAQVAKGHAILNKLESSCLLESLLDDEMGKCVKMHDLIRDMAINITKEHPFFMAEAQKQLEQVPGEEKWSKDLVKVSFNLKGVDEIPSGMAPMTPNLTVLILSYNFLKKIPNSFFMHMRALRVLDLTDNDIERLPESVSDLENLRGLLLCSCPRLTYVPSVAKLTKLRTLDLSCSLKLKEAPSGLERLKCAETVKYIPWDVSNVIGFNEVIQSLTSLIHYTFWIHDFTLCKESDEWKTLYNCEKAVILSGGEFGEDKSSCLVPNTLELLVIEKCDMKGSCLGDVFQSVGEATGVKCIKIKDCRGLESISGSSGTQQGVPVLFGTSKLEILELEELPDLRSIAKLGGPHFFTSLRKLWIWWCPKLKVVLPMTCTNQLHLPYLELINVRYCEEVEEILVASPIRFLTLPNLKRLILQNLPKIKMILPFTEELYLPNLELIIVSDCEEVEEIFETNRATLSNFLLVLPKLKELNLWRLPKLKTIFPMAEQLQLPCLSTIKVRKCEQVEDIFGSNKGILSSPILSLSLPNLKELTLEALPKIKFLFPFIKELHLPNLEAIDLRRCDEVEEIFESRGILTSNLRLSMPNLKKFAPNLKKFAISDDVSDDDDD